MKSRRTIKKRICMLAMLSFLACTLFPLNIFNIPKVNADAQEDLDNSLTWAKAYLDRSYTELGYISLQSMNSTNQLINSGFESGTSGWSGTYFDTVSSPVHSGSYSARLLNTRNIYQRFPYDYVGYWNKITYGGWFTPSSITIPVDSEFRFGMWFSSVPNAMQYPEYLVEMGFTTISSQQKFFTGVVYAQSEVNRQTLDSFFSNVNLDDYDLKWQEWKISIVNGAISWYWNSTLVHTYSHSLFNGAVDFDYYFGPSVSGNVYIDDTYLFSNDVGRASAMKDLPGLPFVIEDVTDDKWMCPAKATQAVNDGNDGPDWGYYGGCGIDVIDYGYDLDRLKLQYRWDTQCDNTFDGVVMYVELISLDNVSMTCLANITSKTDSDHCALWLDNETVIDPVTVGASFERTRDYGWFTTRFVVRHGTKIAANMYNVLGETDKATKLLNLWYGSGYTKDTYDGIWAASNDYAYYEMGYPWAANPFVVMPDPDMWGDIPWFQMSQDGTNHPGVPYRSQLQNEVVRMLGFTTGPGIALGKSWWECGFTFKMAWACYLLNKYNTSDSSKLAEAKQLIDDVSWNGLGISSETLRVGPALLSLYAYACYVPYANAEYLAALTKYWQLTGDEFYGQRADEVAGILLKVQVKPGDKIRVTDSNGDIRLIWRPDNTGGFMCGYKYGGGFDFGSSPWWLADTYFWATSAAGLYNRDYAELSSCGWTNHETTLMSYAALYQYNKTERTPLTSTVDFTMPFFNAQASTSHSDHGCDSIQADNSGNIRTFLSESAYGESWSMVTYSWTVTLPALTNLKTKLTVYIPYYGQDGNAVERWVRIYHYNGTLLVSDYDKPINGVGGYGETYIIYTNMTPIDSLNAGIYTFKLTFRFSCGWAGEFAVGYRYDYLMRPTEPMHIETFGCNFDAVPTPLTPKYYVHICSSGPGTVYPYGDFLIDEGQTANSTATPEPSKYFWYWTLSNTALGVYQNFTANPFYLYVDHDYNVTAYFGDTVEPPPPNRTLVILNRNPTLGNVAPSPGNYSYVNGTSVNVTAVPNDGCYFYVWLLDGQRYSENPIMVTLSIDHTLQAVFKTLTVYFIAYDKTSGVQLLDGVEIYYLNSSWIKLPTSIEYKAGGYYIAATGCPSGTHSFRFSKFGYYSCYVTQTVPAVSEYYFPLVCMNLIRYSYGTGGTPFPCPRLIVAGTDLGIIDIHSPHDVIRNVVISSLLISKSYENEFTKLTLIEGYPGLAISESHIDYVTLNGEPMTKAYLNGRDVTDYLKFSDDVRVFIKLNDKLDLYFAPQLKDSIFEIEGFNIVKMSSLVTFYATMPYSNETQYADLDHYIRVQVLPGTNGTLKLVIHYDTDYPIVEIDAENLTLTEFDLEAIYQHYCLSSYQNMQQTSHFTGLRISSNTLLQINLEMPQALDFWHRPSELLKIGEDGGISSFSSWQYSGRNLTLNFEPGDPTLSMLFHAEPDAMTLTFWNLIPFIFIVGSVAMLIPTILAAKRRNFKEFAILLVGFLIMTALIPIIPQLMA